MRKSSRVDKKLRELADELAKVKDGKLLYDFLYAVLTPRERENVALRWELVKLLEQGLTQRAISERLGVSLCKTTRGSRELKKGRPGFRKIVKEAVRREQRSKKRAK